MTIADKPIWDKIKEKIRIPDLINLDANNRCECLVSGNSESPSCEYYEDSEIVFCHKCQRTMDVIEVYAILNNMDRKTAIKELAIQNKIPFGKIDKKRLETEDLIYQIFKVFMEKCYNNPIFKKDYYQLEMRKRGFTKDTIEKYKIGLFDNSIRNLLESKYSKEILQKAGFVNQKENWNFSFRIVYPYLDHRGDPKYFIYRRIDENPDFAKSSKYRKQMKTEFVEEIPFGLNSFGKSKDILIITEGITDAMSVIQAGYPCLSPVTIRIKKKHIEKMINYCKRYKKVVVVNDNEESGEGLKGAITTLNVLLKHGINAYIGGIPNPEKLEKIDLDDYLKPKLTEIEDIDLHKTINDSLREQKEKLTEIVKNSREGFDFLLEQIDPDRPNEDQIFELLSMIPENDIAIRGVYLKKLKKYTKLAQKDLDKINEKKLREKELKEEQIKKEEYESEIELGNETKQSVDEILNSENKFTLIKKVLDYTIVNEDKNKVLVFLLLSGAYSNNYQIILAIGDSTGGKSHIADHVVDIFPEGDTFTLTGASDKALIYKQWDSEKILHIPECQRNTQILENLKDFGDRGIYYYYVDRNENNQFETFEKVIGVKSVILTTTIDGLNPQLENRAWKIEPDLSVKQSKAIVERSVKLKEDMLEFLNQEKEQRDKEVALQIAIKTFEKEFSFDNTEINYLSEIKEIFVDTFIKIRRDHKKFFTLIEIIANWNYRIRSFYEVNDMKILLSHPNDLMKALDIGEEIFMYLVRNLTPVKAKILECFELLKQNEIIKENNKKSGTLIQKKSEVQEFFKTGMIYETFCKEENYKKSKKTFRNLLNSLTETGYLEKKKKGKENVYKLREENTIKLLDNEKKKEIYIKAFELYNHRIEILKEKDNIKVHEKRIKPLEIEAIEVYSNELYFNIIEIFQTNEVDKLDINNLIQTLSITFDNIDIEIEIYNMVKIGLFKKDFNNNLIYEKDGDGGENNMKEVD